ncbi:hypothetical protein C8R45DRAFT_1209674 [Mycena sanguinolenta]|nr:hypothetical protein C8R45DRAFT_1209674 [Mycena sanguinolenta]
MSSSNAPDKVSGTTEHTVIHGAPPEAIGMHPWEPSAKEKQEYESTQARGNVEAASRPVKGEKDKQGNIQHDNQ